MAASELDDLDLPKFHTFAVWMAGDRAMALKLAVEVIRAAPEQGFAGWARAFLGPLVGARTRTDRPAILSALDDMLRTELTISPGDHPQIQRDPRRLHVLQWELKRACLFAVMRGVAIGPRAVFILVHLLEYSPVDVAAMLGVTPNSVRIHMTRATKVLNDYLGARCEHMAPGNTCRCDTRLGVALERGFVRWPEHGDEMPQGPAFTGVHPEAGSLYRSLPGFGLDPGATEVLAAARRVSPG